MQPPGGLTPFFNGLLSLLTGRGIIDAMIDLKGEKNIYLSNFARFEKDTAQNGQSWLHRLRKAAMQHFTELGFPNPRNEDWKFTSAAPIAKIPFRPATSTEKTGLTAPELERAVYTIDDAFQLVFVNGHYEPALSKQRSLPDGVLVMSLAAALRNHRELLEAHLGHYAAYQDHAFTALNTAFIQDGAFVYLPAEKLVEAPIHLVFVTTAAGEGAVSHPRNLIVAGTHSQATIVETYTGLEEELYFTNAVTEILAGESAVIDHYKIQRESREAFHVATLQARQHKGSTFSSSYCGFGGALVRNEVRAALDGEGCECTVNGLYMANGRQHMDNHTVIDHAKARCASHELYKGILDGKAHGVFNGKIFVHQDAQKTDAKQTNKTLLLSDDAVINTKPQLEIYADDVKCTHGATVGQLEEDAIFYLRSRGIDRDAARRLLTFAFANDIIGRVKVEPIRARLEETLLAAQHLSQE
jgi:Fe-S cluster assembly protein SufD